MTLLEPTERGNASGYGQFVLAALGTLITLGQYVGSRRKFRGADVDRLVDNLAAATRSQWEAGAAERGLLQPAPLPIRWRRCPEPVAGPAAAATKPRAAAFDPLPGIDHVTTAHLREGTHRTLHRIYGGLASGRMILVGGPGAGKSSAAALLLLDALHYRRAQTSPGQRARIPVPVMFTLHGWDPDRTSFPDWVATKLAESAALSGRRGRRHVADLLRDGRIAVFLDGLDEIPAPIRPAVLRVLGQQTSVRLVLLSRTQELLDTVAHGVLAGAVALELKPPTPTDAATYLLQGITEPAPRPWRDLVETLNGNPESPVARALASPLTISLLRDIYPPRPAEGSSVGAVDELLDEERFPDAESVTDYLLDQAIEAAYAAHGHPRYSPAAALRTLTLIAEHLRDRKIRDLERWTIPDWLPVSVRVALSVVLGAVTSSCCLMFIAAERLRSMEGRWLPLLGVSLLPGVICGVAAGFAGGVRPLAVDRISVGQFLRPRVFAPSMAMAAFFGLVLGLIYGSLPGVVAGTVCLVFCLVAVSSDLMDKSTGLRPVDLWRNDVISKTVGCVVGLSIFGAARELGDSGWVWDGDTFWAVMIWGTMALLVGLMFSQAWMTMVAQLYLTFRYRTPLRLGHFLEDARHRHLLRSIGPAYQFRHATLQDRLAPPAADAA
ncbi:hypothetical protein ILP97_07040 [Amycolatopsis sp. H6(2020)]|nr:hypothetical protein [Amycolatopsis sp. H6(2020)]